MRSALRGTTGMLYTGRIARPATFTRQQVNHAIQTQPQASVPAPARDRQRLLFICILKEPFYETNCLWAGYQISQMMLLFFSRLFVPMRPSWYAGFGS